MFYVLAGAVLADLALGENVRAEAGPVGTTRVAAVAVLPPSDELLRDTWSTSR